MSYFVFLSQWLNFRSITLETIYLVPDFSVPFDSSQLIKLHFLQINLSGWMETPLFKLCFRMLWNNFQVGFDFNGYLKMHSELHWLSCGESIDASISCHVYLLVEKDEQKTVKNLGSDPRHPIIPNQTHPKNSEKFLLFIKQFYSNPYKEYPSNKGKKRPKKKKLTFWIRRHHDNMHSHVIGRELQLKGIKLLVQGIPRTHHDILKPCLFFQLLSQLLHLIPLENKGKFFSGIIDIPIFIRNMVIYDPPISFPWCPSGRITRLHKTKIKHPPTSMLNDFKILGMWINKHEEPNLWHGHSRGLDLDNEGLVELRLYWIGQINRKHRRAGSLGLGYNLRNIDFPQNPILGGGSMRNIVGYGVSPRRQTPICAQEVAVAGLELDLKPISNGLPLHRRIQPGRHRLKHLLPSRPQKKMHARGRQILAVAALQADHIVSLHAFHLPLRSFRRSVPVLAHILFVLVC